LTPVDSAGNPIAPKAPPTVAKPVVPSGIGPVAGAPVEPKITNQSVGFKAGRSGYKPEFIIMHSTDGRSTEADLNTLKGGDPDHPVGVHYLIGRDGKVYHLVNEADSARHAGNDKFGNYANDWTLGIEQSHVDANPSEGVKGEAWTDADVRSAAHTAAGMMKRWNIPIDHILAHSDWLVSGNRIPWTTLGTSSTDISRTSLGYRIPR
jgi:N-acetyl-anhydromuramyl-L-alanine amidase AmpD